MQNQCPKVDYLFAGAGASATLLLMSMEKHGLLKNKSVIIFDPHDKQINDKTFCFWSEINAGPAFECKNIISRQWDEVSVNRNKSESLSPQNYFHISSIDLYNEQRRIIEQYDLKRIQTQVSELETTENGIIVKTEKGNWNSKLVFDSRPPKYLPLKNDDAHLLQSFIGYVIETEQTITNTHCVDLMDFNVEQQEQTQFVYVLPFGSNKALVELTRFGSDVISRKESLPNLEKYIHGRFGKYRILEEETGCIPMSTAKVSNEDTPGIIKIGGRAGAIKPSTGYAFKNMYYHAEQIAESLKNKQTPKNISKLKRFSFYDRLLLLILSRKPSQGKFIFQSLFKNNSTKEILNFLDEKSTFYKDLKIFSSLPLKPFITAVFWVFNARVKQISTPVFLLLTTSILCLFYNLYPQLFNIIQVILFTLGLIVVGIPHGAVDHLLDTGNLNGKIKLSFILNYLGLILLNLLVWLFFSEAALLFFIVYSAWHFGQTDLKDDKPLNINVIKYLIWGGIILSTLLLGHVNETNKIFANMNVWQIPLKENEAVFSSILLSAVAFLWFLYERNWKTIFTVLFLTLSILLPLVTAFGIYFIGQHSINGWSHLKQGMKVNNKSLFLKALPFTAGAVFLFIAMFFLLRTDFLNYYDGHLVTIFFVFISCISFPHVIAMNNFYYKQTHLNKTIS